MPSGNRLRLRLNDGSSREVDHALLGTGYRVDVTRYPFLAPELSAGLAQVNGFPKLTAGFRIIDPQSSFSGRALFLEFWSVNVFCLRY